MTATTQTAAPRYLLAATDRGRPVELGKMDTLQDVIDVVNGRGGGFALYERGADGGYWPVVAFAVPYLIVAHHPGRRGWSGDGTRKTAHAPRGGEVLQHPGATVAALQTLIANAAARNAAS